MNVILIQKFKKQKGVKCPLYLNLFIMKYRINKYDALGFEYDILTEDGGLVNVCSDLGATVSTYYQNRIQAGQSGSENLLHLQGGKAFIKEWDYASTFDDILNDALGWLVMGNVVWERDDSIWQDVFPEKK